ncbi:hypothetical protein O1611_g6141 [Lasiodiplodia mahajangana]|uniref:Uncharacterized protein n=1 Tax=Lasiodiplodia mahajangana TaxID=1108764 RepID=A0ACC2JJ01_9PEZI|nr:hypothetical protein O1611_g6141 [Lasiodiplodia mahajangana]
MGLQVPARHRRERLQRPVLRFPEEQESHGDDWLEAVRYFADRDNGEKEAERLANQQREWANKVLRHEDMEVWFFRLLLEYGRVIDDHRASIGYTTGAAESKILPDEKKDEKKGHDEYTIMDG